MHLRTLNFLVAVSVSLLASGVWTLSQGQGENGLSLLLLGLGCSLVLLLVDLPGPERSRKVEESRSGER